MPVEIIRNDITRMKVDAIVNAANKSLLGGGGVDGAIHRAAGPELLEECRKFGGCPTGEARITGGYKLPARYVIHTPGPVWQGGRAGEEQLLRNCYMNSLLLAKEHGCESVAFPLISSGVYRYPKDQALRVAMDTIRDFLMKNDMLVYLVMFDKNSFSLSSKLYAGVAQYIDDNYALAHRDSDALMSMRMDYAAERMRRFKDAYTEDATFDSIGFGMPLSLEDELSQLDESFSQTVIRLIRERGMKNSECYKKANIDKKLFSKINNDVHYKPRKSTALALAIALELNLTQTQDLLMKAGYALSHSEKFDVIVEYFIKNKRYDIFEINEVLFYYDQTLLGGAIA